MAVPYPPVADLDLWISTAEAVLARGQSLADAVATADRVILAFWRNQRVVPHGPGIAKCPVGRRLGQRRILTQHAPPALVRARCD